MTYVSEKESLQLEMGKIMKGRNLIGKGKYAVRVVDQPLTKLAGRLKDKSS